MVEDWSRFRRKSKKGLKEERSRTLVFVKLFRCPSTINRLLSPRARDSPSIQTTRDGPLLLLTRGIVYVVEDIN